MIDLPETEQSRRAQLLAIEAAFLQPGSAATVAQIFSTASRKLHASDISRIWSDAKAAGRLPNISRPPGGPNPDRRRPASISRRT